MNQTNALQLLPLNISSFNKIHDYNMIYVDKTELIYSLITRPSQYFLSRPRRFGKSLFVSVLKHLFLGHKDYFKHTWIYHQWHFEKHPVLIFDFNEISHENPDQLTRMLSKALDRMANAYELPELTNTEIKEKIAELIEGLYQQYQTSVIVLVDEYDKPIIDHIGFNTDRLTIATANRFILKQFFGSFKGQRISELVSFLFITGVSKFSHVSIFSDLNNLIDLTMDEQYSTMLGYTLDEMRQYFYPWIEKWAENKCVSVDSIFQKLKDYYDGFRFSKHPSQVYNPISILNALQLQEYKNYWFQTATPTFLINLLIKEKYSLSKIETLSLNEDAFSSYELENLNPSALLFQTGYITICDAEELYDRTVYRFSFPNIEVRQSFLKLLMIKYGHLTESANLAERNNRLYQNIIEKRFAMVIQNIQDIYNLVPDAQTFSHNWFHQFFYMMIRSACYLTQTINIDNKMVIMIESDRNILFTAFSCIYDVNELIKWLHQEESVNETKHLQKELYVIGIHFDANKRMITDWTYEHLNPEPVVIPESQKFTVKIIRLFLASSSDLENERKEIGLWINRKNKELLQKNLFIELVVWEELLHSFQGKRVQEYFNEEMLRCDIVIALFYSKVGQFTKEEFELAYTSLKEGKKPHYLFVGFKTKLPDIVDLNFVKVIQLRVQIEQNEQLYLSFESVSQLILKLDAQLNMCLANYLDKISDSNINI
jgi:hypothetical protein